MSASEYYELLFELSNLYNSIFEFWITATFAFLIAIHVLGNTLSNSLRHLLTAMYVVTSIVLTYRFVVSLIGSARIIDEMALNHVASPPWMGSPGEAYVWSTGMTVLMIIGSIASALYAYSSHAKTQNRGGE